MMPFTPLVSLLVSGATLTEHDDLPHGGARLGQPVWGPMKLLAELELRLGLPSMERGDAVRVQQWSRRLDELLASGPRFHGDSYRVDPLGTATALLRMRDELVDAGWNGERIPAGGERLATFADLEAAGGAPLGVADRLRCVEQELRRARIRPVAEIRLAEPAGVWPARWRRVFDLLADLGVPVRTVDLELPATSRDTDLGRVQSLLRGDGAHGRHALEGDGSLVVLRAETTGELAVALAALLRRWNEPSVAILRGGEDRVLDDALVAQALPSIGALGRSTWRPACQVLPLAIELAFEPRDPYRVLELLTLPIGPFAGTVGRELARAVARSPGVGGAPWRQAKERIAGHAKEDAAAKLARVSEWLEAPGHVRSAPRSALLAVAARVRTWLQARLAYERDAGQHPARTAMLGAAFAQAQAFEEALGHDPRESLDRVDARLLVEQVSSAVGLELSAEGAGRVDPVDSPAGLRVARDVVVWWHCVSGTEWRPSARPWRRAEIAALGAAGVVLGDATERLAAEAHGWRRAVLAARKRLVLAVPRWAAGEALQPHPIWDEIVARLGATGRDVAQVTFEARALLEGNVLPFCAVDVVDRGPLLLPEARAEWRLDAAMLSPSKHHSASSLEALVGCPLRWVLTSRAGLRAGSIVSISDGPVLSGTLGHRLVEVLHEEGSLRDVSNLSSRLQAQLDRLLREEASVLLRAGATFELAQLRTQLHSSILRLAELLVACRLEVVDVESRVVVSWRGGELECRLDLLLHDARGQEVIVDLKWGESSYSRRLRQGRAIQLAVYAAARRLASEKKRMPPAGYFSLSSGELVTVSAETFEEARAVDGPSLEETWDRLERTVQRVEAALAEGRVPVVGVHASLPLLESLRVAEGKRDRYLELEKDAACQYCPHDAICGRRWEVLA